MRARAARSERQVVELRRIAFEHALAHLVAVAAQRLDDVLLHAGIEGCGVRKVSFEQDLVHADGFQVLNGAYLLEPVGDSEIVAEVVPRAALRGVRGIGKHLIELVFKRLDSEWDPAHAALDQADAQVRIAVE